MSTPPASPGPFSFDRYSHGTYRNGQIHLDEPVNWPEGVRVAVRAVKTPETNGRPLDQAVIAGFGLAGRAVADLLDEVGVPYTVIEKNPATVRTQNGLGRRFIAGDTSQEATLAESGVATASLLALTIPDVKAVLAATAAARKLSSAVYIIARTTYSSEGLQAMRLGANEVIKAEQAVALQFYERVLQLTGLPMTPAPGKTGMV